MPKNLEIGLKEPGNHQLAAATCLTPCKGEEFVQVANHVAMGRMRARSCSHAALSRAGAGSAACSASLSTACLS
jgi:hypothetical protein